MFVSYTDGLTCPSGSFGFNEYIMRTKASDGDTEPLNLRSKLSDGRT